MNTPETFRRSRPIVIPSARTKKAGQALSRADEFAQLIQTWFAAAAAVMEAGMVIPG
jgi:hypothetical protein